MVPSQWGWFFKSNRIQIPECETGWSTGAHSWLDFNMDIWTYFQIPLGVSAACLVLWICNCSCLCGRVFTYVYMCLTTSPQKAILKYLSLAFLDSVSGDHLHSPEVWHHSDRALQSAVQSSRTLVQERQRGMAPPAIGTVLAILIILFRKMMGKWMKMIILPLGLGVPWSSHE